MTELSKRIHTSIVLFILFGLSIYNNFLLFFLLIFCFYQIFWEFFNLLIKIISKKNYIVLILILFLTLCFLTYLIFFIWVSINSINSFDKIFLLMLISISITSDIGGYIFGKTFKGKKLTSISPNKTYSGMFGSYIVSSTATYFLFISYVDQVSLLVISLFVSTISQIGDLFISFLKRRANIKDTGNLLPGHGGILDRFDGIIFALTLGSFFKIII